MSQPTGAFRARRLDRLRERSRSSGESPQVGVQPAGPGAPRARSSSAPGGTRAEELARVLGGHVVETAAGTVTIVETRIPLRADLGRLVDLPDPIAPDRPIVCLDTETTGLGTAAGNVALPGRPRTLAGRMSSWYASCCYPTIPTSRHSWRSWSGISRRTRRWSATTAGPSTGRSSAARYRLHGRPPPVHAAHLDLLRRRPPGVASSTAGRPAGAAWRRASAVSTGTSDLPGALIPERYFSWLRTGRAELFTRCPGAQPAGRRVPRPAAARTCPGRAARAGWPGRSAVVEPRDLAGLGRLYARRGRTADALVCFDQTLERLTVPWRDRDVQSAVAADRARALGRLGRRAESASAWEAVALDGGPMAPVAWIAVAKSLEHVDTGSGRRPCAARRADTLAFRLRFLGQPQPLRGA